LVVLLVASGCFLEPPEQLSWLDDDHRADDDDSGPDDDDVQPDDDDAVVEVDMDGDGHYTPDDCDDGDPTVYPGAEEVWDFKRTDCDAGSATTEVLFASYPDGAGDSEGIVHDEAGWQVFGASWSLGDVNGDGAEDLCARAESDDNANIYVFLSIEARLNTSTSLTTDTADVVITPVHTGFGNVDCSRDLDGDGATDLVFVSLEMDGPDSGQGGIYVFDGGSDFETGEVWTSWNASATALDVSDWTGRCFGIGQLDGEGDLEVVYAAHTATADGDPEDTLVVATPNLTPIGYVPVQQLDSNFPDCFVVDDLSGDGTSEIVIHDGQTRLVLGEDRIGDGLLTWADGLTIEGFPAYRAISADITGDGLRELILGDPWWSDFDDDTAEGAVLIFFGRSGDFPWRSGLESGGSPNPTRTVWLEGDPSVGGLGTHLCAAGDPNRDGIGELAIGSPGGDGIAQDEGEGLVFTGRTEDAWKDLAYADGRIAPGAESSRFVGDGGDQVGDLGASWGTCGYTWQSDLLEVPRIWWKAWGPDEDGVLLYWVNQTP